MKPPVRLLDRAATEYIKSQLESGQGDRIKRALQYLCKLYRQGYRIPPELLSGVEVEVVGLLSTQAHDEKVRRWALNAIARLGRKQFCLPAVTRILKEYSHEPQTAAAAIAAIYKLTENASETVSQLNLFDPQTVTLAALQHVEAAKLELPTLKMNIEKASSEHLKLALIVVGLDRAPSNLFHPTHSNSAIVKALGGHHDNVVSQYTVWAITENPSLGLSDLGIDLRTIEQQPVNVRSWVFQLIGMSPANAKAHLEYIELGSRDPNVEPRSGLAIGIKETYFDGLERLALEWLVSEPDGDVRMNLIDHIVRKSHLCPAYERLAIEFYEKAAPSSEMRNRMTVNGAGLPIFSKFKRIDYDGQADFFSGDINVTNKTKNIFNISAPIQSGAVSFGGDAENSGTTSNYYNQQTIEAIQSEFSKALEEIRRSEISNDLRGEAERDIKAAQTQPTPDNIKKALSTMDKVVTYLPKAAAAVTAMATIGAAIAKLAGFL